MKCHLHFWLQLRGKWQFFINFYFSHEIPELNNFSGIEIKSRECPKISGSFGILRVKMIDHTSRIFIQSESSLKFYFHENNCFNIVVSGYIKPRTKLLWRTMKSHQRDHCPGFQSYFCVVIILLHIADIWSLSKE